MTFPNNIHNPLIVKEIRSQYNKILSNIIIGQETRALELLKNLINSIIINKLENSLQEEELKTIRFWPHTLLESAESMNMTKIVSLLKNHGSNYL